MERGKPRRKWQVLASVTHGYIVLRKKSNQRWPNTGTNIILTIKPRTDEQVYLNKFYLLVCTRKN